MTERAAIDGHGPGNGPWIVFMRWEDLLFAHWRVSADVIRPLIPPPFELETFDDTAWLGVVPFRMARVHPRFLPPVGIVSDFPELNLRTYVRHAGRSGVWFFSLDAADRLAVLLGRRVFRLPYHRAQISTSLTSDGWIDFRSSRLSDPAARFAGRYRPQPDVTAPSDELTMWLTTRDVLWTLDRHRQPVLGAIRHAAWPLQAVELELDDISIAAVDGVAVDGPPAHLAFSRTIDVVGWRPVGTVRP